MENFKSITLTLPCQGCFCWGGVRCLARSFLSTPRAEEHLIVCKSSTLRPFLLQSHFTLLEECFACAINLFLPKHVTCHTYWEPVTNQFFRRTGTVTLLWHCGHMCERDCEEWRMCIIYMILQLQHKQKVRSVILCVLVWMKLQSFFCF